MRAARQSQVGAEAVPWRGVDLSGKPWSARPDGDLAVVFLTSSCRPCQAYWQTPARHPAAVYVTADPSTEDRRRVSKLAAGAGETPVVMATEAWLRYGVTKAPWLLVVRGGRVVADQPAPDAPAEALVLVDRELG